jgi:hypothetical protein
MVKKFVVCIGNPNKTRHLGIHHVGGGRERTRYAHRPLVTEDMIRFMLSNFLVSILY